MNALNLTFCDQQRRVVYVFATFESGVLQRPNLLQSQTDSSWELGARNIFCV